MEFPNRKRNRLENFDYSSNGAYFITICVKDRKPILSKIQLSKYGIISNKYINQLSQFYDNISVDKYVIMPDHIHLLISIRNGQSWTTRENFKKDTTNSVIAKFVSTFKRFCNKEVGHNIWQSRYYDHIIRNQDDYNEKWEYIENNPAKWLLMKQPLNTES